MVRPIGSRACRDPEPVDAAGFVPQPRAEHTQGSGSTVRIGRCNSRATVGTRLPRVRTEKLTTTTTML